MDEPIVYYSSRLNDYAKEPLYLAEEVDLALMDDDKDKMLNLINTPGALEQNDGPVGACLVFANDAVNCAISYLSGETQEGLFLHDHESHLTPLHLAVLYGAPRITKLLLDRGGHDIDAKCNYRFLKDKLTAVTPLDMCIALLKSHGEICDWTPIESIFELLVALCELTKRRYLETARLLIQNTQDKEHVQQKFIKFAVEGQLFQAGVLLIAAPDLLLPSCLSLRSGWSRSRTLHDILQNKETRTEIHDGLALLLDAFAIIGDKLVAFIRLRPPDNSEDIWRRYIPAEEVAYFLREAVYDNRSVRHADEYFLRFFKPVLLSEAEKGNTVYSRQHRVTVFNTDLRFDLLRTNLSVRDINRLLPQPEDAGHLTIVIEKKLASSSTFRRLPACFEKSERGELTPKRKESGFGFPFVTSGNWPMQPLFKLRHTFQRPVFGTSYRTSIAPLPGEKLMGQSKLKSLFSTMNVGVTKIISIAKRLAK